ncbi:MAG TPA: DEAD/DEAH box helicase [Spirochaetia bacterium]|nr:MAG: DEAD/DEAH box helicase [Spirochaetes bacterium GWB1_36_13]HCL57730.1 DEAD/DEAH box helicase [Spirochaetia bacterium]
MSFQKLNLIEPILKALEKEGYTQPTPIQQQAIPVVLEKKDLLGCAQTGTGKTAAFAIPILQILFNEKNNNGPKGIKALILTPTRELAVQIGESFSAYGRFTRLRHTVVFGGVSQRPQVSAIRSGVDILIATPGRLLDLIQQGFIHLNQISMFVLDEADRMLDMGFINDIKKIIAKMPLKKQTLFFSATMPPEISKLAENILIDPAQVAVTPVASTVDMISQSVYFVDQSNKKSLLLHLLNQNNIDSALIFTRTKHGADRITKDIMNAGIYAEAIHGNKSQNARQNALNNFKAKRTKILVATDIAARGIDVDDLSHVINYELPEVPETYVHRIGRTGRAGLKGTALSFCNREERDSLRQIHKLIAKPIPVIEDHPFHMKIYSSELETRKPYFSRSNTRQNSRSGKNNYRRNGSQTSVY